MIFTKQQGTPLHRNTKNTNDGGGVDRMDLSIVIVSWNGKDLTKNCLKSIFQNIPGIAPKVFVVDNGSNDGTQDMIAKEFPQVELIANNYNAGFAKANNQAINRMIAEKSLSDFVLLLNQDMLVLHETLSDMVRFMREHPEAGVAGCHLVDEHGKTVSHVRRLPTLWDQAAILLKLPHIFPHILDRYLMSDFDYGNKEPQEVDSIRGSFFMIRKEVIEKLGGLDELYFFWFEEVDYCRQVKNAGWKVMYTGETTCVDFVGQSVKKVAQFKRQKMFTESMLKYFGKWQPRWQWAVLQVLRVVALTGVWVGDFLRSRLSK